MGRRSRRSRRCPRCQLHLDVCLCADIPTLALATRVVLVMHTNERHRPTASGPLALAALPNHDWLFHGVPNDPIDLADHCSPDRRGLLLFPGEGAAVLSPELLAEDTRPVTLIVPDGNWRQASKAARRTPGASLFEPVTLPPGPPTRYRLRRETKDGGLATMEAIARALGIIEGPHVQTALEVVFLEMVKRTLDMRQPPPS